MKLALGFFLFFFRAEAPLIGNFIIFVAYSWFCRVYRNNENEKKQKHSWKQRLHPFAQPERKRARGRDSTNKDILYVSSYIYDPFIVSRLHPSVWQKYNGREFKT